MAIVINELSKYYIQKLQEKGKVFIVCKDLNEFSSNIQQKNFVICPYQTEINKMWGVVYWETGWNEFLWYSATPDQTKEREEVEKVVKKACQTTAPALILKKGTNAFSQTQKTNTDNSVEYSEAFADYMANKLIELQYKWHVSGASASFNDVNFDKNTIDTYKKFKDLSEPFSKNALVRINQIQSDLNGAKVDIQNLQVFKDRYNKTTEEWNNDFKIDFDNKPFNGADSLKLVKAKLTQLTTDKAQAEKDRDTAQGNLTQLTTDNKAKDKTISDLNGQLVDKNKELNKLNGTISDNDKAIIALEKRVTDKDKVISERDDTIKTLRGEYSQLQASQVQVGK